MHPPRYAIDAARRPPLLSKGSREVRRCL